MNWRERIGDGLSPVVDMLYPPRCPSCGAAVIRQGGLCPDCWDELDFPSESKDADVVAATLYNDVSRQLVISFKHGGKTGLAKLLGRMIAARLPDGQGGAPLIIPVPLHPLRLWQRGYNQAALLAREIERAGKGTLLVDGLTRNKSTPSLGGLGSAERERVLKGAIVATRSRIKRIGKRPVILVDDVFTSGATTSACRTALMDAGAYSVTIACFAKVGD